MIMLHGYVMNPSLNVKRHPGIAQHEFGFILGYMDSLLLFQFVLEFETTYKTLEL